MAAMSFDTRRHETVAEEPPHRSGSGGRAVPNSSEIHVPLDILNIFEPHRNTFLSRSKDVPSDI